MAGHVIFAAGMGTFRQAAQKAWCGWWVNARSAAQALLVGISIASPFVAIHSAVRAEGAPILGTEVQKPRMTRPEDRGEDFSKLDSHEVVQRLAAAMLLPTVREDGTTKIWDRVAVHRKAAKVLGDREIARTLKLTEADRTTLRHYIDTVLSG